MNNNKQVIFGGLILLGLILLALGVSAVQVNSSTEIYSFNVTNMQANMSQLNCSPAYVRFSANITPITYIDHVIFTIEGSDNTASRIGNTYYYDYYKVQNSVGVNGSLDFNTIKIYDVGSGFAYVYPNISVPINCTPCHYNVTNSSCQINDSKFTQYIGDGSPDCMSYNTSEACNYCTENLIENLIVPCNGTTKTVSYNDSNYASCCAITHIANDCDILYYPYNTTSVQNCSYVANDFTLQCDPKPILQDKINCLINLNQNKDFKCWTMVRQQLDNGTNPGNYLQVNPTKTEYTSTVVPTETESREYFTISNGVGSVYYTNKNLVADTRFLLAVKCVDTEGNVKLAEQFIQPVYSDLGAPVAARGVWAKYNIGAIFIIIMSLLLVLGVVYLIYHLTLERVR